MLKRNTTFVTLPIVALAAAAIGVVLASLAIGARETDGIALTRQRETIEHALHQHGMSLARELRAQTVWNDGYEKAAAGDKAWLQKYYGTYLNELLGYDGIYVISSDDKPIFGFRPDGEPTTSSDYAKLAPQLADLVRAVRSPESVPPEYKVVTTNIALGGGKNVEHRAVADVRDIDGHPSAVVVSTIVPDHDAVGINVDKAYLLIAADYLDKVFTKQLGINFGFRDLRWVTDDATPKDDVELVKALNGANVGTLAWHHERPGIEFIRRVAPGLGAALLLLGALTYFLVQWSNRQARRLLRSEALATRVARTDPLTGLPNRAGLRDDFNRLLGDTRAKTSTLGVLSIDIDQFKGINDAFGHAVGDGVLVAVTRRLQRVLASGAVLARPDGDSFVMLVPDIDPTSADELAADVVTSMSEPFDLDSGARVFITASVGTAIGPGDGNTGDDLLRRAELAVDKAKEAAGETAVAFAPAMDLEVTYRRTLETALRKAVADGALNVLYQPLMDASGTRVLGVEALARWTDPLLGPVSPDIFIPLAEETGLIQNVGELVLRRACEDGKAWPCVSVAVNVSAAQIHHGDVVEVVREVLRETRFPAERLEIEITESVLLADEKRADEQMRGLQALGVKVALDDFGTGYSSLQYLRNFGFDKLKIDRSFVDGAGAPQDSSVILASIIRLGQDLDLTITAEGVETAEQQRWLHSSGCHQLQGFLFSRPLSADQITQFIARHNSTAAAVAS